MKAAFVISKFPCYDEAFILRELYAISKTIDVTIFSLRKSKDKVVHDEAKELMPKVIHVPYLSKEVLLAQIRSFSKHPLRYISVLAKLVAANLRSFEFLLKNLAFFPKAIYIADWAERNSVDHVHAYWATYPASVALIVEEMTGKPFSFTGHAHDIYLDTTNLRRKIEKAKFVSTCTKHNKEYLARIAPEYPEERVLVIHHGLDLDKFARSEIASASAKERWRTSRNDVVDMSLRAERSAAKQSTTIGQRSMEILSVGTLQEHKGFNFLIDALSILKKKGILFHATFIGGGPLEADLKKHIALLRLEQDIKMTGALKQTDVIPYYKRSDIHVLMAQPEWHWGIPNVLIEALAAKSAVVTTRFGSVEELIEDGVTGLIVPPKDEKVLAETLERLCRDENFRKQLAENGCRRVVENFDLSRNVKDYLKAFAQSGVYEAVSK